MSYIVINAILSIVLILGIGYALKLTYDIRQRRKLHNLLLKELKHVTEEYSKAIKKKEKKAFSTTGSAYPDLTDPSLLASLITVLVRKGGKPIRLTMNDFANVSDKEYVSVYVDISTNDLILSAVGEEETPSLWPLNADDDGPVYN